MSYGCSTDVLYGVLHVGQSKIDVRRQAWNAGTVHGTAASTRGTSPNSEVGIAPICMLYIRSSVYSLPLFCLGCWLCGW